TVLPRNQHSRLDLIFVKIERAKELINDLKANISALLDGPPTPYEIVTKDDTNTGETVYYGGSARAVPLRFAAVTGDALQNLRSALDHLAWQLVDAADRTGDRK